MTDRLHYAEISRHRPMRNRLHWSDFALQRTGCIYLGDISFIVRDVQWGAALHRRFSRRAKFMERTHLCLQRIIAWQLQYTAGNNSWCYIFHWRSLSFMSNCTEDIG